MPVTEIRSKHSKSTRRPLGVIRAESPYAPPRPRRVLIATDGGRSSSAAIKLARAMQSRGDWAPFLVTVLEPLPVAVGEVVLPAPPSQYELAVADGVLAAIKAQIKRYGDSRWDLRTEFGSPTRQIVRLAAEVHPDLITIGLGRHGRLARMLGAETTARVARQSPVPLLAVSPRTWYSRHTAVAAVDFGDASVRAAREVLELLEQPGKLHLLHVRSRFNTTAIADTAWEHAYAAAADAEFGRLRATIGEKAGIETTSSVVAGNVVDAIIGKARAVRAHFIAIGSHNESVLERMMIGSTPTELLRQSPCSVLIAPPAHATP